MSKAQIQSLKIGDVVQFHINGYDWQPQTVVEIHARGTSVNGLEYVCFYTTFGPESTISGSCHEDDGFYSIVSVV